MSAPAPLRIAILGAESTGKSSLSRALAEALAARTGLRVTWVPEWLRAWCDAHGRTPQAHEQAGIAQTQRRRIEQAAQDHDIVVADTTPLMTALYSRHYFGDDSLLPQALAWQRGFDTTLVTRPDIPWTPDGIQREGPAVRERVDRELTGLLDAQGLRWSSIEGDAHRRLEAALAAVPGLHGDGGA